MTSTNELATPQHINQLYTSLRKGLLSYAQRFVHDRALAEDVVQEVFIRLMKSLNTGMEIDLVKTPKWLKVTTHNLALNTLRDRRDAQQADLSALDDLETKELNPEAEAAVRQELTDVLMQIMYLSPSERKVMLRVAEEYSAKEIAAEVAGEHIKNKVGWVAKQTFRGREKLH